MRKRRRLLGEVQIAVGHPALNFAGAEHRIDYAGEFRQHAVAGGLDDPAMMRADLRIDQFDEMRLEAFVRALFIRTHQARIPTTSAARIAARRRVAVVVAMAWAALTPAPNLTCFERESAKFMLSGVFRVWPS
jgi:hypothetical protein